MIAVVVSPLAAGAVRPGDATRPATQRIVVVRDGDTLWSIAQSARPSDDPRVTVEEIERTNGVEAGSLIPGQTLAVPTG